MMGNQCRRFQIDRTVIIFFVMMLLLSGCMYPNEQKAQSQKASLESINTVQIAVNQYYEKNNVLPIKNSTMDTPIYEKYVIDFSKLIGFYLNDPPPNAFEKGGEDYYVLIDVEREPTVKLMNIVALQQVNDVQRSVDLYVSKYGKLPLAEETESPGWYAIDYDLLNIEPFHLNSFYSPLDLSLMIHSGTGEVMIDYAPDIMRLIQEESLENLEQLHDLRELLVKDHLYVPIRSYPYTWINGIPVAAQVK